MKVSVVILFSSIIVAGVEASPQTVRTFDVAGKGRLDLVVPAEWRDTTRQATVAGARTITFSPAAGSDFTIIITVMPGVVGQRPTTTATESSGRAELHANVERSAKQIAARTVELSPVIQELRGVDFSGYYFSVTDAAPGPDDFPHLTQGATASSTVTLSFTILTRHPQAAALDAALDALRKARWIPDAPEAH